MMMTVKLIVLAVWCVGLGALSAGAILILIASQLL